jgi:predicted nucleotidyltransferase
MSTTAAISRHGISLPTDQIADFCRRWKIRELAVFGSFLREDFRPDSDLDFLYTFADDVPWTLFDLVTMEQELAAIVGRDVDLVDQMSIEKSDIPYAAMSETSSNSWNLGVISVFSCSA